MPAASLDDFYRKLAALAGTETDALQPSGLHKELGHFNVLDLQQLLQQVREKPVMPYDRRSYYKISLLSGRSRAEYADKVIEIEGNALIFATPRVPYHWVPQDLNQVGQACVFTAEFMLPARSGVVLDELPLFRPGGCPVLQVTDAERSALQGIFGKMQAELASDYAYKFDLLRAYLLELIHAGQKLQPAPVLPPTPNAAARITALFQELLEREVARAAAGQPLPLRTPRDYAERLAVHVNHLNKALRETTGRTTTELIGSRLIQEAKLRLRHTAQPVSEIADALGFAEVAHFSNYFKRQTSVSPLAFRA